MTTKTSDALRRKAIKMVQEGNSKTHVAKALGLGVSTVVRITKHVGKNFSYYPEAVKQEVLQRINAGQKAASIGRVRIPMIPASDSGDFDRASRAGYFLL